MRFVRSGMSRSSHLATLVIALAGLFVLSRPAQANFTCIDLGTLGGLNSVANAINNQGIAVGSSDVDLFRHHAFIWRNNALVDLGTLGGPNSVATAINELNVVVGQADTSSGAHHACRWLNGVPTDLGTLGGRNSIAYGINKLGVIVGAAETAAGKLHACCWQNGSLIDLGTLGGPESAAYAINDLGQIVGEADVNLSSTHGFQCLLGGLPLDLGTLGGGIGQACAINSLGQITGSSCLPGSVAKHACLYGNNLLDLGLLNGLTSSAACGINNAGLVVGTLSSVLSSTGFIYSCDTLYDLSSVLKKTLCAANGINDLGQIAGCVQNGLARHACILAPAFKLLSVSINPSSVTGCPATLTGTVSLDVATAIALPVTLSCNNPAISCPGSVVIPAGQTSATFTLDAKAVTSLTSVNITAALNLVTKVTSVKLYPIGPKSISVNPSTILGGNSATGTLTLNCTAGSDPVTVALSSNSPAVSVPASVTVPAGQSSTTFPVTTTPVSVSTTATLQATLNGVKATTSVKVRLPGVKSITLSPGTVSCGNSSTATVTLEQPAPIGGAVVTISNNNPAVVSTPDSVAVAEGMTSITFQVGTLPVIKTTSVAIKANWNGVSQSASLTVQPVFMSLKVSPNSVYGGISTTGIVTLSCPAPVGGVTINLSSSDASLAALPSSVTVAQGATSATFVITTAVVNINQTVTISGTSAGTVQSATLTLKAIGLGSLSINPTTVAGGASATGTVTLNCPAGAGGTVVCLASDNPAAAVPATITIPAGSTKATFTIATSACVLNMQVHITATLNGTTKAATMTVRGIVPTACSILPTKCLGGLIVTGSITLSGPAIGAGLDVQVTASNSACVVIPLNVHIDAGLNICTFLILTKPVLQTTPVTITVSANGVSKSAVLTLLP